MTYKMSKEDITAFEKLVNIYLENGSRAFKGKTYGDRGDQRISVAFGAMRKAGLVIPSCGHPSRRRFNVEEAARMLSQGLSTEVIGRAFGMTPGSVETAITRAKLREGADRRNVIRPDVSLDSATATA